MNVVVDLTRCQGYGQCAFLAPEVFRMRGDEALMYEAEPDDAHREAILRAEAACPMQAIRVGGFPRAGADASGVAVASAAAAAARCRRSDPRKAASRRWSRSSGAAAAS